MAAKRRKRQYNVRGRNEHDEQVKIFEWKEYEGTRLYPETVLLHATINQQPRYGVQRAYYSAEGLTSGIPDVCLPVARAGFSGLWIEMKNPDGKGRLSDNQKKIMTMLDKTGSYCAVCIEGGLAITLIHAYLEESHTILEAMRWRPDGN